MSYMTLSSQQKALFQQKKFLDDTYFFTLVKLSRPSHNTTSQNIEGTNAWAVPPPQIFGGPSPQSPLGLRPCPARVTRLHHRWGVPEAEIFVFKFLPWPGRTSKSNGRELYHSTTTPPQ